MLGNPPAEHTTCRTGYVNYLELHAGTGATVCEQAAVLERVARATVGENRST